VEEELQDTDHTDLFKWILRLIHSSISYPV
jgi:hypothetical protein